MAGGGGARFGVFENVDIVMGSVVMVLGSVDECVVLVFGVLGSVDVMETVGRRIEAFNVWELRDVSKDDSECEV